MPQIGPLEILVVAVIALIVFGPEKLPDIARQVGKAAGELRRMAGGLREEFETGLERAEEPDRATSAGSAGPPTNEAPPQEPSD